VPCRLREVSGSLAFVRPSTSLRCLRERLPRVFAHDSIARRQGNQVLLNVIHRDS